MQGIEVPIKDIYNGKATSAPIKTPQLPASNNVQKYSVVGAIISPPTPQQAIIPDVIPMRRGRPTKEQSTKPSSPLRKPTSDPWAVLNSSPKTDIEDVSNRFPSLDEFSLFHHEGNFDFGKKTPDTPKELKKMVTEHLADTAFAIQPKLHLSKAQEIISSNPKLLAVSNPTIEKPTAKQIPCKTEPKRSYVSQGTMTTDLPQTHSTSPYNHPAFPSSHHRSLSTARNRESSTNQKESNSSSPTTGSTHVQPESIPSYISLENIETSKEISSRAGSNRSHGRPTSTFLESNIDFLREQELTSRTSYGSPYLRSNSTNSSSSSDSDEPIENRENESNASLLKQSEVATNNVNRNRLSKTKSKGASFSTIGGSKLLRTGKFGDAFKLFEQNLPSQSSQGHVRIPSPLNTIDLESNDSKVKTASETLPVQSLVHGATRDESLFGIDDDKLAPEQRREVERRRLSIEEKRVSDAAAEYRKKVADRERIEESALKSVGVKSHSIGIQNKVKNLLDERQSQKSPNKSIIGGYGRLAEQESAHSTARDGNPYAPALSKPSPSKNSNSPPLTPAGYEPAKNPSARPPQSNIPSSMVSKPGGARPNAPPKPVHLNQIANVTQGSTNPHVPRPEIADTSSYIGLKSNEPWAETMTSLEDKEVYLAYFSKRFPSLSSIEMVEREIDARPNERIVKGQSGSSQVDGRPGVRSKVV
ncbi:hypothetical protein K3495_g7182 [Podosphaera aphanis]|nr:hypothetical protein K3495_g7182 [Podosphaera aphanis]